jgi:hypothetical protein
MMRKKPDKDKISKLFRPITYDEADDGTLFYVWVYSGREKPPAPYDKLIRNYKKLDADVRLFAENYVDELFTEEEANKLMDFLSKKFGLEAYLFPVKIPVSSKSRLISIRADALQNFEELFPLKKEDGYPLPFEVKVRIYEEPSLSDKERSQYYIHKVFEYFGLKADPEVVAEIVEEIYIDEGLYVAELDDKQEK